MLAKVNISEAIELALCCPDEQAMLFLGEFGIGKTQVCCKIGKELGLDTVIFDCTHLNDAGDILGLPSIVNGRTVNNPTFWYNPDKPVLLVFDEVFRATPEVRAALMTLTLEQKIADKKLAKGSRVIALANPPGFHGYEGEVPDPAQLSRYAPYWLEPTFEEFYENAKEIGCHQAVLDYLNDNKRDLHAYYGSSDMNVEAAGDGSELVVLQCQRSWIKLSDNLKRAEKVKKVNKLDKRFAIRIASAYIGPTLAVKFAPYYMSASSAGTITAEKVLNDWASVKAGLNGEPIDVATATKVATDIKFMVKEAKKIPAKWKTNYEGFIMDGLSTESKVAIINDMIYNDMMKNEDWIFEISTDKIQSYYEEIVASKVA